KAFAAPRPPGMGTRVDPPDEPNEVSKPPVEVNRTRPYPVPDGPRDSPPTRILSPTRTMPWGMSSPPKFILATPPVPNVVSVWPAKVRATTAKSASAPDPDVDVRAAPAT